MIQSMRFKHSDYNVDITEMFDNKTVDINFWTTNGNSKGQVPFNEFQLRELRKWITIQIRRMNKLQKTKQATG